MAIRLRLRPRGTHRLTSSSQHHLPIALPASVSLPLHLHGLRSPDYPEPVHALRLLAAELTLGLLFLHGNGIVHQDVKPANILVSAGGHVVLGDFGAMSRMMPLGAGSRSTGAIGIAGTWHAGHPYAPIILQPDDTITFTPLYAAPELTSRDPTGFLVYDAAADWWSTGVVLYELATGCFPFPFPASVMFIGGDGGERETLRGGRRSVGGVGVSFGALGKMGLVVGVGEGEGGDGELEGFLRAVSVFLMLVFVRCSVLLSLPGMFVLMCVHLHFISCSGR